MTPQQRIAGAGEVQADPAAHAHVRRVEVPARVRVQQRFLLTIGKGQDHGEAAVVVMVGAHHREDLARDEEGGFAVRETLGRVRLGEAEGANARGVLFDRFER